MEFLGFTLYAFADDFSLILSGRRRLDLEIAAERALAAFHSLLTSLHLKLSPGKSQELMFAKPRLLKRKPIMRIDGKSIKHVNFLKVLGITIDNNLSWTSHVNELKLKLAHIHNNTLKLVGKNWGVKNEILKLWYQVIIEKIVTYGAGVWAGNLTKKIKEKINSLQRPFLLQMSRGYRTISTDALQIITGNPPLTLVLEYEYHKSKILLLKDIAHTELFFPNTRIQYKSSSWQNHPAIDSVEHLINTEKHTYTPTETPLIYTDGSRSELGVASAFCALKGDEVLHEWSCRLENYNTIYQAELYAIQQALVWRNRLRERNYKIYTDSLSSLQALTKSPNKHPIVRDIKIALREQHKITKLAHVSAHIGIKGNELADKLAKEAINQSHKINLPVPPSHVKSVLKNKILQNWQLYWDNSIKGRHTHNLIPKVTNKLYNLTPSTTAFLTGHGPFPTYLHRFKIARDNLCACGQEGTPQHIYQECILTQNWHIKNPTNKPSTWLTNILNRPLLTKKLTSIYDHLLLLSNLT